MKINFNKTELFSACPCSCGKIVIFKQGNHHPWCSCGNDQLEWSETLSNVTREEAEKFRKEYKG